MSTAEHTDAAASWHEEMRSAFLYRAIAEREAGTPRATLFRSLADEAEKQADVWAKAAAGASLSFAPDARTRLVAALVRRLGPRTVRGMLAAMKVRGLSVYDGPKLGAHPLPGLEGAGSPPAADYEARRHRGAGRGGTLRAAVFGVNDGLLSNCSLMLGVAGAATSPRIVLLTGVAGMLAGAFSMAAGEFVSMRSQREMFEFQIGLERSELEQYPEEEAKELALVYTARGLSPEEAHKLATSIMSDKERALDALAREELGLNPDDLGSPWGAALSSFTAFAAGALVPLVPFLITTGRGALLGTIGVTAVSLFTIGAAISLFTGRSALRDGLRMLAIGAAASSITYAIGSLFGVTLGG